MTEPVPAPAAERVRISCPGCGRHDWVLWPQGQDAYHWKCFNCGKQFELEKGAKH
jgi:transposase-like protein